MSEERELGEFGDRDADADDQQSGWQSVKLSDVARKRSVNVDPEEVDLDRHVGLEHIEPNTPNPDWEPLEGLSSTKRRFEPGDILFAKLRPNLEKAAQPDFEGVASTDIFPIVAEEGVNQKYLLHRLSSKPAFDHARRTSVGTRMPRTSWNLFENFEFELPPSGEQRKIASILYNVDQAVEKLDELNEQTERLKNGVIQDMIENKISETSSPTELGEVPDSWEKRTLEATAGAGDNSLVDGPFGSSLKSDEYVESGYSRIIQLQNVKSERYVDDNVRYVNREKHNELERHAAEPGDLIIAKMASPVARTCILPDTYDDYMLGCADVVKLKPDEGFIDEFIMYSMNSYPVWKQAAAHIRGSGRLRVNLNQLKGIELPQPPINEQERIVDTVESLNNCIAIHNEERGYLQRLKQGLMQDLLSGEVRTTDADIEVLDEVAQHG